METFNLILPVILYILLTILVVVLIIFFIRLINTVERVNKVVDDINKKVSKLDGVFNIIDVTTDTLAFISDKVTGFVANKVMNLFGKKNKKEEE